MWYGTRSRARREEKKRMWGEWEGRGGRRRKVLLVGKWSEEEVEAVIAETKGEGGRVV